MEQRHKEVEEDKKRVRCRSLASLFTRPWRGTSLHFRIFFQRGSASCMCPAVQGSAACFPSLSGAYVLQHSTAHSAAPALTPPDCVLCAPQRADAEAAKVYEEFVQSFGDANESESKSDRQESIPQTSPFPPFRSSPVRRCSQPSHICYIALAICPASSSQAHRQTVQDHTQTARRQACKPLAAQTCDASATLAKRRPRVVRRVAKRRTGT